MIPDLKNQPKGPIPDISDTTLADLGQNPFVNEDPGFLDPPTSEKGGLEVAKTQGLGDSRGRDSGVNPESSPTSGKIPDILPPLEVKDIKSDPELIGFWLQGRRPRTVEAYRLELRRFFAFTRGVRFRELTVSLLLSYADSLKPSLGVNAQALALAAVKSILSFGFQVGYLDKNLGGFLKIPKRDDKRVRKVLDESKIVEMIFSEENPRNRLMLRLLYSGGLRVSELTALKWRDLQVRGESGQIVIRGKGDKQRIVLLSQGTWSDLKSYRNEALDSDPIFPSQKGRGHLSRMQVLHLVKEAAIRVGLSRRVSPHWMRHSHATHALERGASIILVKETLGHGSIVTTQKYLHSRPEESSSQYLGI